MYNLTVDEAHTFYVGDGQWLVHNICKFQSTFGNKGRLDKVVATVKSEDIGTGTGTTPQARALATKLGNPGDQAGHAIAKSLGGPGGAESGNIFPQSPKINMGAYRAFELQVKNAIISNGKPAQITVEFEYASLLATRPTSINYTARIGELLLSRSFLNP